MKKGISVLIFVGAIVLILIAIFLGTKLWFNLTWFGKLGYVTVFKRILWMKVVLWFGFFFLFVLFSGLNIFIAFKKGNIQKIRFQQQGVPIEIGRKIGIIISITAIVVLGLIMAKNGSSRWMVVLKYFNKTSFNLQDPIYHRDVSYYVFTLPLYLFLKSWCLGTLILTLIAVSFLYFLSGNSTFENNKFTISDHAKRHILFLIILIVLTFTWGYWLKKYMLLFSTRGLIYGAGYTDVKLMRPAYYTMIAVTLLTVILTYIGMSKKLFKQMFIGFGILIGAAIIVTGIIPGIYQQMLVKPSELQKELPYIKDNIQFTREGYNINNVVRKAFAVEPSLTEADFGPDKRIQTHIRLWDTRPLKATFSQLQEFRLYYTFPSVNTDRYHFGDEYRQIMIAAREINYSNIPQTAKTWVNERLQYTHGYGVVMSPVDEIGSEGLPKFFVKNIPPVISVPIKINRPEIYYGEETFPYVIANTRLPEFDYPKGNDNVMTKYKGTGGIPVKNGLRKLLLAIHLKSYEIIFTKYITPQSRVMVYRSIQQRAPKLAPFLRYDNTPYIVISKLNGRLYWIIDAYTTTDKYPYSNPYKDGFNYIRNSVKITVDAYNGDVNFYVVDPKDPIIRTYRKIFPHLFKDFSDMPKDLAMHVRYPRYIFDVQAQMYSVYHMIDPNVFYNKEDKWSVPNEIYGQAETKMIPYYAIVKFPDMKDSYRYVLMLPFTPSNKNNMISWVAAVCDPQEYGRIIEYQFPKEKLVFGPMQIESRIDQNTEISRLFTLWGQRGSKVIRGNLLIYPVKNSLIYVEPIYLRSEQSQLPELKRVVLAYQDKIGLGTDLQSALDRVFGPRMPVKSTPSVVSKPVQTSNIQELLNKAMDYLKKLQKTLNDLKKEQEKTK